MTQQNPVPKGVEIFFCHADNCGGMIRVIKQGFTNVWKCSECGRDYGSGEFPLQQADKI